MKNKKAEFIFYIWFAAVPLLCVLLDLFMSTIQPPHGTHGDNGDTANFDISIINQFIYISVWVTIYTSSWGIIQIINMKTSGSVPKWMTGKNALTTTVVLEFLIFLVYGVSIVAAKDTVAGFDTWYKITKSILEHFITPILIFIFYFIFESEKIATKEYARKYAWYVLIVPSIYIIYIVIRAAMLYNFAPEGTLFVPWPYTTVDPFNSSIAKTFGVLLVTIWGLYGAAVLFNFLSNRTLDKWIVSTKKHNHTNKKRA